MKGANALLLRYLTRRDQRRDERGVVVDLPPSWAGHREAWCEYCNADDDRAVYAHDADEVCADCLVHVFHVSPEHIANAPTSRPVGATYDDIWLLKAGPSDA